MALKVLNSLSFRKLPVSFISLIPLYSMGLWEAVMSAAPEAPVWRMSCCPVGVGHWPMSMTSKPALVRPFMTASLYMG